MSIHLSQVVTVQVLHHSLLLLPRCFGLAQAIFLPGGPTSSHRGWYLLHYCHWNLPPCRLVLSEIGPVLVFLPRIFGFVLPSCLFWMCLLRCAFWTVLYWHFSHWWRSLFALVSLTFSFTSASVVNIAIPALFSITFPFSVSPWSFFVCLSIFHLFTNVFLHTTQEAALIGVSHILLLCNLRCFVKIFFVENFLEQMLQMWSMGFWFKDLLHFSLCLLKLNLLLVR